MFIFGVSMYYFAAVQQTITTNLPSIFQRLQRNVWAIKVNKTKIEGKNESDNNKNTLFEVFLQICKQPFNQQTAKDVIYAFQPLFCFYNFSTTFCSFEKLRISSFDSTLILEQNKSKFWRLNVLVRSLTCLLTLRPRMTYINVFQALFVFLNFYGNCRCFQRLGVNSSKSTLNFEYSKPYYGV